MDETVTNFVRKCKDIPANKIIEIEKDIFCQLLPISWLPERRIQYITLTYFVLFFICLTYSTHYDITVIRVRHNILMVLGKSSLILTNHSFI